MSKLLPAPDIVVELDGGEDARPSFTTCNLMVCSAFDDTLKSCLNDLIRYLPASFEICGLSVDKVDDPLIAQSITSPA